MGYSKRGFGHCKINDLEGNPVLDRRFIAENVDLVLKNCADRHVSVDVKRFVELEEQRLALEAERQEIRTESNAVAKDKSLPIDEKRSKGAELKAKEKELNDRLAAIEPEIHDLWVQIPNLSHPASPIGKDDTENQPIDHSAAKPGSYDFKIKDHVDLGAELGMLDMTAGSKVATSGFYFLKGDLALLEIALMRFGLDRVMERGYEPTIVPEVANDRILQGTGFQPRGDESNTFTVGDDGLNLIATAEIALCGMHADSILNEEELPVRSVGVSHCFRTERAAGRATRGLYRVHQFQKVEMVAICLPKDAEAIHQEMLEIERKVFDDLEVPYRVLDIATGDLGAAAYRKYDLEAWMPGRGEGGEYGEVTSTSNCTDYQSRRLRIRYKNTESGKNELAYTLNGTGLAVGRAMIAILENFQNADGSVSIPEQLRPYFGKDRIAKKG